jgi:uncharacterized protein (DUF736 family)
MLNGLSRKGSNMAKFVQKQDSGSLFKNDKKTQEKQPDFTGTIDVGGNVMRIAAWKKTGKKGTFLSLKVSDFQDAPDKPVKGSAQEVDELGF